jgi:hypothetical protein
LEPESKDDDDDDISSNSLKDHSNDKLPVCSILRIVLTVLTVFCRQIAKKLTRRATTVPNEL